MLSNVLAAITHRGRRSNARRATVLVTPTPAPLSVLCAKTILRERCESEKGQIELNIKFRVARDLNTTVVICVIATLLMY